jgi:isopentenyl-diphosphate Delta-isomerase
MNTVSDEMPVDVVDSHDHPMGVVARREVLPLKAGFRVAHDLIFNSHGDLLVQQLSEGRARHPGQWGSSVAAYLFSGESYEEAARRRLREELGISIPLNFIGKTSMDDDGSRKFIGVFTGSANGPFRYDRQHIAALEFLPVRKIQQLMGETVRLFTPTFRKVFEFYESIR